MPKYLDGASRRRAAPRNQLSNRVPHPKPAHRLAKQCMRSRFSAFVSTHSRWLALRAGVLRRAVSWATSPVINLRCVGLFSGPCEVCLGHLCFGAPPVLLQQLHLVRITIRLHRNLNQQLARLFSKDKFKIPLPNHSLNRTLHSLSAFGLKKPSPNPANLFRAG